VHFVALLYIIVSHRMVQKT